MVKKRQTNKTSVSTMKKVKAAMKKPPCRKNPYGIKCDKKLKSIMRSAPSAQGKGSIAQKQNINIQIGALGGLKRRQAKSKAAVKDTRAHSHFTVGQKAAMDQAVIANGSLWQDEYRRRASGLAQSQQSYGMTRPDLTNPPTGVGPTATSQGPPLTQQRSTRGPPLNLSQIASRVQTARTRPAWTQASSPPPTPAVTRPPLSDEIVGQVARGNIRQLYSNPMTPASFRGSQTDDARQYTFGASTPRQNPSLFSVGSMYQSGSQESQF